MGVLLPQASSFGEGLVLQVLRTGLLLVKFIDQIPRFTLKTRILVMTPPMVMSPFSAKPVLILSFDFGLTGLELSIVEIRESTVFPHTLLEVCPTHKDKVEIKCMGSVGGKTLIEPKLYLFFSFLRHVEQDEVDVVCFVQL